MCTPHVALYGNAGSTWAEWYHDGSVGPLAEVGIYNLKTLTAALGPVVEVQSAESLVVAKREISGQVGANCGVGRFSRSFEAQGWCSVIARLQSLHTALPPTGSRVLRN